MKPRKYRYFMGDFETTVYNGQTNTEVWAAAAVELYTEDVKVFHSIGELYHYFVSLDCNVCCYFHNLKFDGTFWISYLLTVLEYKQAAEIGDEENVDDFRWLPIKEMPNKSFNYSVSDMGQWYRISIKINSHIIEFRDSLKLLPFSVKRIGSSFRTKHKKLDMEYKGLRYAGCPISAEEEEYIKNDVLVVKEALEIMFEEGHKKLTIGSCCLAEYKRTIGGKAYDEYFPNLYQVGIDKVLYGSPTAGDYVRKSYRGGWCYLAKGKESKVYRRGITADVNSLYPSMMSSESNNRYPVALPTFWKGNYIPDEAIDPAAYYFVRVKTRFYLKPGKLPFVQVKNTLIYKPREMLETSDIYNYKNGRYYPEYIDLDGKTRPAVVTMTLTMTDYELLKEHYELVDLEILDGCYFQSAIGIFDTYINKYKKIKMESKGALRELAKLFLNNLYGKMASNTDSSFKVAYVKEDGSIGFYSVNANDKQPGYIPVGSAITSYARNFTIRAAQRNYHGPDKPGFIYADTDSIHCDLGPEDVEGIRVHDTDFCAWKLEAGWDFGYFIRPKTYIEHVTAENLKPIETPFYNVKCAGMPERCKDLFLWSTGEPMPEGEELTEDESLFLSKKRELTDFNIGLRVPGKLMPKRIPGGVVLVETWYEMR